VRGMRADPRQGEVRGGQSGPRAERAPWTAAGEGLAMTQSHGMDVAWVIRLGRPEPLCPDSHNRDHARYLPLLRGY
jgi:hypothetical protein